MHNIEPFFNWRHLYSAEEDPKSPFYGRTYSEFEFTQVIYNYYIHPQWDDFGSRTLYLKILFIKRKCSRRGPGDSTYSPSFGTGECTWSNRRLLCRRCYTTRCHSVASWNVVPLKGGVQGENTEGVPLFDAT